MCYFFSFKPCYISLRVRVRVLEFCRICAETQPRHETYFIVPGLHSSELTDWLQSTWSHNVRLLCWTPLSLVVWLRSSRYINLHRLSLIFRRFWIPAERVLKLLLSSVRTRLRTRETPKFFQENLILQNSQKNPDHFQFWPKLYKSNLHQERQICTLCRGV